MQRLIRHSLALSIIYLCFSTKISFSQVIPDQTLPTNSTVVNSSNQIDISDGTRKGSNLFHSFSEFNIPLGTSVQFSPNSQIQNIITRVTGNQVSSIDGSMSVNGNANLFLINKNGISFGPNARLNLNGSFLSSTANQVIFENGFQLGSQTISSSENLPSSSPSQLLFNNNQSKIQISGNGDYIDLSSFLTKLRPTAFVEGLQTKSGQALNIVGGEVLLDGGLLSASQGSITIGAVRSGIVDINNSFRVPTLFFNKISSYGNIHITNQSLVNFSESTASIRGSTIDIDNGSNIFSNNVSSSVGHSISLSGDVIRIANTPLLPGTPPQPTTEPDLDLFGSDIQTGINTQTVGPAQGASVILSANKLELGSKTGIITSSFQDGSGGDIRISAKKIVFTGLPASFDPLISTNTFGSGKSGSILINGENISLEAGQIVSVSFGPKDSGDININANEINIKNGASIASLTFARSNLFNGGNSGDINVTANSIRLVGESPINFTSSSISSSTFGNGNGGQVSISAKDVSVLDGAEISSSTLAEGNSGRVVISADEILLSGIGAFTGDPSQIDSAAKLLAPELRESLKLPDSVTGVAGNVFITANTLKVKSGAVVSAFNQGSGDGGTLFLDIGKIFISDGGALTTVTTSGNGGNIRLLTDFLLLNNGDISASAKGKGTGGNINIDSGLVVLLDNSSITANAEDARAGKIKINTLGLFRSPDSQITASSELGPQFDGNVEIKAEITDFSEDPNLTIQAEPPALYSTCSKAYRDTLAYYRMGTGGQPLSPDDQSSTSQGWLEAANARYAQRHMSYIDPDTGEKKPLERVVGWKTNSDGTITFVSDPKEADQYAQAIVSQQHVCSTNQAKSS